MFNLCCNSQNPFKITNQINLVVKRVHTFHFIYYFLIIFRFSMCAYFFGKYSLISYIIFLHIDSLRSPSCSLTINCTLHTKRLNREQL